MNTIPTKKESLYERFGGRTKNFILLCLSLGIVAAAALIIWASTIKIPDFGSFVERRIENSTKIYDRTGKIMLYNVNQDMKRTEIPFSEMSIYIKNAAIAIEDAEFYQHHGIRITSIFRAVLANLTPGGITQGGSTITQQVIKMTLLDPEKTITRKIKEWILAVKLDRTLSKEDILAIYLNEAPYGGNIYGIYEAAGTFFNKAPKDLTLAEAAYLAAIPQAPTYYSPYGKHKDDLIKRKNLVLSRMQVLGFITEAEYAQASAEDVLFQPQTPNNLKAPHFVFYVKDYLEGIYGEEMVETGGLKVTTTLDYDMQQTAEEIVKKYALENQQKFNASNAALVAVDPKTGDILTMVGSRDYFDKDIDGNYNIALAKRQPGSSFKPFVYVTAFAKGYTPNTVLFDVPTEFQTTCNAYGQALPGYSQSDCYMPQNYDDKFRGPMTLRDALAQSINVPAVKTLYLAGIKDSLKVARDLGIKTLTDQSRYGLTLVLGGGEVTLLDMTSAYSVFANGGVKNTHRAVLKVEDSSGRILEENTLHPETVLEKNNALMISDILSDNVARTPLYGTNSALYFPGRTDVAAKTGTTNDYRDVWIVGYTPSLSVGAWAGNNDNTPMEKKTSGLIIAPLWHEFMAKILEGKPSEVFEKPIIPDDPQTMRPVLRGQWLGGESFFIDKISGKAATEYTPKETLEERVITNVHSILYWIDKANPLGPPPQKPANDPQFRNWETAVQNWWAQHQSAYPHITALDKPTSSDDIHTQTSAPTITIISPDTTTVYQPEQRITIAIANQGAFSLKKVDFFLNDEFLGSVKTNPFIFSFTPESVASIQRNNELRVVAYDAVSSVTQASQSLLVNTGQ